MREIEKKAGAPSEKKDREKEKERERGGEKKRIPKLTDNNLLSGQ
jgi:hypothetical protein